MHRIMRRGASWNQKPDLQSSASRFLFLPLCVYQFKCTCLCSWSNKLKLIITLKGPSEFLITFFLSSDSVSTCTLTWYWLSYHVHPWWVPVYLTQIPPQDRASHSLSWWGCWHLKTSGWVSFWELPLAEKNHLAQGHVSILEPAT